MRGIAEAIQSVFSHPLLDCFVASLRAMTEKEKATEKAMKKATEKATEKEKATETKKANEKEKARTIVLAFYPYRAQSL